MAGASDENVLSLLKEIQSTQVDHAGKLAVLEHIRSTQEDHADKLGLLGTVAASVANVLHDVRELNSQIGGIDDRLGRKIDEVRDQIGVEVKALGAMIKKAR